MTKKKLFVFILIFAAVMMPMFAINMTGGGTWGSGTAASGIDTSLSSMSLGWIKNAVNLIVGIFAGGYVLLKAALDIFHAVRNSSEDPNGLKKAIGGLVLNIAILAGFFFVINYVFGEAGKSKTTTADTFYNALSGSLVMVRNTVGL